jgi:hypothetical protein
MSTSQGRNVMVQGRIVWVAGDLFKGKDKIDMNTRQPKLSPNGERLKEYGFGLAVPKSALAQTGQGQPGEIWQAMHEEAWTIYPSRQLPPAFAMKYKDGDGVDHNGQPFSSREGYAGHIVLTCTTMIPIKFFRWENGQNILINDGIKCGDYVNVQLSVKAHGAVGQGKPGLYLNPNAVQFLGYGKEIINTPSGDQLFGVQAPVVPPGASATPIAQPGMLVPQGVPTMQSQQVYQQPAVAPIQAHHAVLPQQFQPPPQAAAPAYQPPQGFPSPAQQPNPQAAFNPGMPPIPR